QIMIDSNAKLRSIQMPFCICNHWRLEISITFLHRGRDIMFVQKYQTLNIQLIPPFFVVRY
ncbi:hypothetical protein, partial [Escherichia coli]|uniref:hypothetical protein n=1 Tax=Escherichia coli TaxID=562 RepID=UPI001BC85FDE